MTDKIIFDLDVPAEHPSFTDHFPGDPIVPGALLLQWIFLKIEKLEPKIKITKVKSVKFLNAVIPRDNCKIEIGFLSNNSFLSLKCVCNEKLICSGKLSIDQMQGARL